MKSLFANAFGLKICIQACWNWTDSLAMMRETAWLSDLKSGLVFSSSISSKRLCSGPQGMIQLTCFQSKQMFETCTSGAAFLIWLEAKVLDGLGSASGGSLGVAHPSPSSNHQPDLQAEPGLWNLLFMENFLLFLLDLFIDSILIPPPPPTNTVTLSSEAVATAWAPHVVVIVVASV